MASMRIGNHIYEREFSKEEGPCCLDWTLPQDLRVIDKVRLKWDKESVFSGLGQGEIRFKLAIRAGV